MLIATYGSLRLGQFNHTTFLEAYGEARFKHIETKEIPGYALYSFGSYPGAIPDYVHSITVDIFAVSDRLFVRLNQMETEAGYRLTLVNVGDKQAFMWVFDYPDMCTPTRLIEHGDWSHERNLLLKG